MKEITIKAMMLLQLGSHIMDVMIENDLDPNKVEIIIKQPIGNTVDYCIKER